MTIHVAHLRPQLEAFMYQQEPGTTLGQALRELVEVGLSSLPPEAAIHSQRRKALYEARAYVYKRMTQSFDEILVDLKNTAVLLSDDQ